MDRPLYNESQLNSASLEYFNGDELASKVWVKKYALRSSQEGLYEEVTPDDTIKRLSAEIHRTELKYPNPMSYDDIYKTLKDFKHFIFGGSIMFSLGNNKAVSSLGNCFFIDNGADSYGGIFNTDESLVQLMKRRGGVGITLEHLRPSTAYVNNSAHSSTGAVSFMDRFSHSTREVAQDGRRGALMITMHINHPDVEDFIMAKDDLTKITGANISVKVTDEFMRCVENDNDYILRWPTDSNPIISNDYQYNKLYKLNDGTYVKRIKAKDLWNVIIKQAHKNAEPGVIFWDRVLSESPADMYAGNGFRTKGTNPCIVGNTLIAVADGRNAISIKQLVEEGKCVPVYSTNLETGKTEIKWARNPRLTKKNAEVWKLILDDGSELIATPDHKILTSKLVYKELKDLISGESIIPFYSFESNGYRQISRAGAKMIGGNFRNRRQYQLIYNFYNGEIDHKLYSIHHKDFNNKNDNPENLVKMLRDEHTKFHADRMKGDKNPYHRMSAEWKYNFAKHVGESNGRYISRTNEEIVKAGKELFLRDGKITRNAWRKYAKENGYPQKIENSFRFSTFDNFRNQIATNHKVKKVEFYGYEDVYNITVDDNNNYHVITSYDDTSYVTSSGICIKNCGEVPLSPYDSCRLGSINLFELVENPFTPAARLNWQRLTVISRIAQRFMDDIVDLEEEKILNIISKIQKDPESPELKQTEINLWKNVLKVLRNGRRTGVGVVGLADMFAALGLTYGTPEATELAERIQKEIAIASYKESVQLAKERSPFLVWGLDKEAGNPFLARVLNNFNETEFADYLNYGRRNISNISIAPTGTLAMMTQTASGIEPVFKIFFRRRRKVNPNEEGVNITFVDQNGDSWEEYNVMHIPFITWFSIVGCTLYNGSQPMEFKEAKAFLTSLSEKELDMIVELSPWSKSETHSIDYYEKINMQAAIQKWVDHSISVTHNLHEKITLDEVDNIYFHGWRSGCKGLTIYREGSRSGVLITGKEVHNDEFKETHAPKRPKELKADYYVVTVKGVKYAVIVGLWKDTNKPYEIFAFENPPMDKNTKGKTVKVKKGQYKFINGEFEIDNIQLAANRVEERTLSLSASMLLRHGAPVEHVINVIKKIDENVASFSSGVRRVLSKYIEERVSGETCPNCGGKLIMQDGCMKCSCGFSKCG